jgi:hypothetical protein
MTPRITLALAALLVLCLAAGAAAQKGEPQLRTVKGQVLDKEENPQSGGVVYLKNLKAQTVRTHISDEQGQYRFSGLDPNVDYEIHAQLGELASAKRRISSFDSRREITINLKLDRRKE